MNAGDENTSFGAGAASIALAASALSEAAQALSEAAATLSAMGQNENASSKGYKSFESTTQGFDSHEADKEKDHVREIDDDDASSVDANTGNNLYRKDATPESNTMTPHIGGSAHVASQSQAQQEPHGGHKQLTTCYVPTSGSLLPWESIISAIIPGREVRSAVSFSGNSILQLSEVVEKLALSNDGSVLILAGLK
ncbi:unnamed protein product [Rhizoctonia solani]|uniref:Uncharacterized protein n=1 Tax=Rhizoctonia solani TaxID=456999 RepID=A0A8H3CUM5_9AGAM|nr:unnamed protein product [Rhizoctonia solani]